MNPIPDDELLSAYLDGELGENDRARAERLLAERPDARQLLEDLRALSGGFEGLPVHRLEQDFPARVLRGAERELLAEEPPGGTAEEQAPRDAERRAASPLDSAPPHSAPLQPSFNWTRWRRPLAWSGLALAAGLLLMVYDRNARPPARQAQVAHAPSARSELRASQEPESALAGDASRAAGAVETLPKEGRQPSKAGDRLSRRETREAESTLADESLELRQRGMERKERENANLFAYGLGLEQDGARLAEPLDEKTLIVWCDVDADVADKPEFQRMLASNQIAWEPDRDKDRADAEALRRSVGERLSSALGAQPSEDLRQGTLDRAELVARTLSEDQSDYVLVDATEEQLKGVLAEFDRHPELFLSVNVEPAADVPAQQGYASYNRARAPARREKLGDSAAFDRKSEPKTTMSSKAAPARQDDVDGKQPLGRAQRVVLQQSIDAYQRSADLSKAEASDSAAPAQAPQAKFSARKDQDQRAARKHESPAAAQDEAPVMSRALRAPAAVPPKPASKSASAAEEDSASQATPGRQQALFIFRRVSPSKSAAEPAEAGRN